MDEDQARLTFKIALHTAFIGIVAVFSYQTYLLAKQLHFTKEYAIFGIVTGVILLYYSYKLFGTIYDYRIQHLWKPSKEIIKEFYEERQPKIPEVVPVKHEFTTEEERIDVRINLDVDKGLFYGKDLNIEEKNYLIFHKYRKGNFVPIGKTRQEEVWVKDNKIESLEHTFLVQNIKLELEKYTKDIEINISEKPDVIFKNKKGDLVAIEVETGLSYDRHEKRLNEKFFVLKERYKHNAVIVLTDTNMKYKYSKICNGVKIIVRKDLPAFLRHHFQNKKKYTSGEKLGSEKG